MIIGIDFDDVLVATNEALALFHNRVYGTSYRVEDVREWSLIRLWGCSEEEAHQRIAEFVRAGEHVETQPVVDAAMGICALRDAGHDLLVVTSRPESAREVTLELAAAHFPKLEVLFAGRGGEKSELCRHHGIDTFIDDALHNIDDVASVVERVLLFDRPWNRVNDSGLPNVHRVHSWREILKILL